MPKHVSIVHDVKTAAVLAGSAGFLGAVTGPFLLPSIFELVPPEQRTLPRLLPLFCVVLAIQFLIIYGLLALAGLRMARARDREPAPLLTAIWTKQRPDRVGLPSGLAFGTGIISDGHQGYGFIEDCRPASSQVSVRHQELTARPSTVSLAAPRKPACGRWPTPGCSTASATISDFLRVARGDFSHWV